MSKAVLKKVIQKKLPSAIPADLENPEQFSVGKVLIHPKKPHKVIPMRGQDLIPTCTTLESLLTHGQQISINLSTKLLFNTDQDKMSACVEVDLSEDAELQDALRKIPELERDMQRAGKEKKSLQIRADLGQVVHVTTDLVQCVGRGDVQVDVTHAVVKRAMENGGAMFIVGAIYRADHCKVSVKVEGGSGNYVEVINYDQPVPLAHMLVKVNVEPSGMVESVLNKQLKSSKSLVESRTEPDDSSEPEEVDYTEHYLYCEKDFQPFESNSYHGILEEARSLVAPLTLNRPLQDALLTYTKPPHTYERLNILSAYFLEVGNAMRTKHTAPQNKLKDIDPIINALSDSRDIRLDEITAVIIVAEAADEFPQHIVQKIIDLPADKRRLLLDLILDTPYGSSRHAYADEGPYNDPTLKPILFRMGFSIPAYTHNLLHTRQDYEEEEDTLTAAIILMLGSEK